MLLYTSAYALIDMYALTVDLQFHDFGEIMHASLGSADSISKYLCLVKDLKNNYAGVDFVLMKKKIQGWIDLYLSRAHFSLAKFNLLG